MFADIAKIAVKVALIAVITTAVIAVFTVEIPVFDLANFQIAIGKGLAFIQYWVPGYKVVWTLAIALFSLQLAILALRGVLIAYRWIFKVNE